jgi:hypothetical protein
MSNGVRDPDFDLRVTGVRGIFQIRAIHPRDANHRPMKHVSYYFRWKRHCPSNLHKRQQFRNLEMRQKLYFTGLKIHADLQSIYFTVQSTHYLLFKC